MANNVPLTQGPLVVGTYDDGVAQHQGTVSESLSSGGKPVPAGPSSPLPTDTPGLLDVMTMILVELRVNTELLYVLTKPEAETIEDLRAKFQDFPIRP